MKKELKFHITGFGTPKWFLLLLWYANIGAVLLWRQAFLS